MSADPEIAALRAQLQAVSNLLDAAERRLLEITATPQASAQPIVVHAAQEPPPPDTTTFSPPPIAAPVTEPKASRWPAMPVFSARAFLAGPRGLAIIGGSVLILGLAFLYVVAIQQGILGPEGRTVTGAVASVALIAAGLVLERRGAGLVGAVAAVGAGIAGLYMALVSATRIFDLIPAAVGLGLAALVAAGAVLIAHRWRSQLVAVFGLCGALAAPVLLDVGITPLTIGFVLILAAAVAALWLTRRWHALAIAGGLLSGAYIVALVAAAAFIIREQTGFGWNEFWQSVLGVGLFWGLLVVVALAHHRLRAGDEDSRDFATTLQLSIGTGALAVLGVGAMFLDAGAGWALLVVAGAYAALVVAPRLVGRPSPTLSITFALIALAAVFLATLDLLGGSNRATVLALQAGGLAVVAGRLGVARLQWAAAGYLGVAAGLVVTQAAPIRDLFAFPPERLINAAGDAMDGGATLGAIAAATALAGGAIALAWSSERLEWGDLLPGGVRLGTPLAAVAILFAVATAVVYAGLSLSFTRGVFQGSHALVSSIWGVAALGILVVGLRRQIRVVRTAGLALLGATLAKLVLFDLSQLTALSRAVAFVVVGLLFVAGSVAYQRLSADAEPDAG